LTVTSFFVDSFAQNPALPAGYPISQTRSFENLSVNLLDGITNSGTITVTLLRNGAAVPGFTTTFTGPVIGPVVQKVNAGPVVFSEVTPDTFDLQVSCVNVATGEGVTSVAMSATVSTS
jgi:hypothetical protein